MRRRRGINVFSLSFLDAMTCGFGAVILFYMVINASVGLRAGRMTADLEAEVDLLEDEVLEGYKNLVELKNSLRVEDEEAVVAQGLSARLAEQLRQIQRELATYDDTTLARREHVNRLKADLRSLEEEAKRLSARLQTEETPGDRLRTFVGDGDRQYLTGLKVGGKRIFVLVDSSASMLGDTLVNVLRRRNLPDDVKVRAEKWQQAVATVDWVTTQIPRESEFQIYRFADDAGPVVPGTDGQWLDGNDAAALEEAVSKLRQVVPEGGTSLWHAFNALREMNPPPDNVILLVDGLPTRGKNPPRKRLISAKDRAKLYNRALEELRSGVPVNVILFPMEGDPMAASAYWKLAVSTRGAYLTPSRDWP